MHPPLAAVLAAPLLLPRPAPACCRGARPTTKVVNVYNWSDYIEPDGDQGFREAVRHQGQLRRLRLQRGARDQAPHRATPTTTWWCPRLRSWSPDPGGASTRSSTSRELPNLKNLDPEVQRSEAQYDPGNRYAVDYMWITSGLGYNAAGGAGPLARCAGRQLAHALRPGGGLEAPGLRRDGARCADGGDRHRAAVPGQEPEQRVARGPRGRQKVLHGHPALRALRQLLTLHRRSRQW